MALTALRALCLLLSALCAGAHVLDTVGVFRRWSPLDGRLVAHSLLRAEARSRVQCSSLCVGHGQCRSFTYEEDRRACSLHRSHWPLPGGSRPGAATFHRKWTQCPQDWDLLNGTLCVKLVSSPSTWDNAVSGCRELGGSLISLQTESKRLLLRDFLLPRAAWPVWTGASDREEEGQWRWVATGEPFNVLHWGAGEPNGGAVENCMGMYDSNLNFVDAPCTYQWQYMCEMSF